MTTIAKADAATRFEELMERTAQGETFEVVENGHPLGRLMPPDGKPPMDRAAAEHAVEELIAMRGFAGEATSEEIKAAAHASAEPTSAKKDPARAKAAAERLIAMAGFGGPMSEKERKGLIEEGRL